jgi:hypothetical protein
VEAVIDSTKIDELLEQARTRDNAVTAKLLAEVARLPVIKPWQDSLRTFSLDTLTGTIMPGKFSDSGMPAGSTQMLPEDGSYAYQLYSAICFVIDARAQLKLLELIASPTFYDAIMRSAAEKPE